MEFPSLALAFCILAMLYCWLPQACFRLYIGWSTTVPPGFFPLSPCLYCPVPTTVNVFSEPFPHCPTTLNSLLLRKTSQPHSLDSSLILLREYFSALFVWRLNLFCVPTECVFISTDVIYAMCFHLTFPMFPFFTCQLWKLSEKSEYVGRTSNQGCRLPEKWGDLLPKECGQHTARGTC